MSDAEVAAIQWQQVTVRYGSGPPALDSVSAEVRFGRALGLAGPNGAGKTSLLKTGLGLEVPVGGRVILGSRNGEGLRVTGVIEEPRFYPRGTARENLEMVAAGRPEWQQRIGPVAVECGIAGLLGRESRHLSQGERQRLGIARALLGDPDVLLLDEPANALDPDGHRWIGDLVQDLTDRGRAVVVSSHLLASLERHIDDVILLKGGRVIASGPTPDVLLPGESLEDLYFRLSA